MTVLKQHVILLSIILQIMFSPTFICHRSHPVHEECRTFSSNKNKGHHFSWFFCPSRLDLQEMNFFFQFDLCIVSEHFHTIKHLKVNK